MARAPDKRIEQAKEMYLQGRKLVEIASQLNLPEGTVRRWKCTHKWDNERSDKKSERSESKKSKKKKAAESEVDQVIENPELTDKQRLFCIYYIRSFNATKAYQKAYGCSYENAMQNGSRMLRNDKVKEEIIRLKQNRLNQELLSEEDIFQKYMDIAFSDITDYVEFGTEKVPVMTMYGPAQVQDPKTGKKKTLTETVNIIHFRDSSEVDGSIISEVKHGKNGSSIKLADRMKALQWLADHMNLGTEEQRARIAQMKAQTDKLTGNNQEIEDLDDIEGEIYGSGE
ncbi:terminase small subunit [Blautia obeum]|uniref:terminase small subunit n=1 Tax=Blautia obeum TaxID=40520 RepID=UPI00356954A7